MGMDDAGNTRLLAVKRPTTILKSGNIGVPPRLPLRDCALLFGDEPVGLKGDVLAGANSELEVGKLACFVVAARVRENID